ncbi:MAG: hypothetical protein KAR40_09590 [Candidatus Sabulitectum sp.]|nr:hypothetical protein [Candidatus Sabulitectum sp.]
MDTLSSKTIIAVNKTISNMKAYIAEVEAEVKRLEEWVDSFCDGGG